MLPVFSSFHLVLPPPPPFPSATGEQEEASIVISLLCIAERDPSQLSTLLLLTDFRCRRRKLRFARREDGRESRRVLRLVCVGSSPARSRCEVEGLARVLGDREEGQDKRDEEQEGEEERKEEERCLLGGRRRKRESTAVEKRREDVGEEEWKQKKRGEAKEEKKEEKAGGDEERGGDRIKQTLRETSLEGVMLQEETLWCACTSWQRGPEQRVARKVKEKERVEGREEDEPGRKGAWKEKKKGEQNERVLRA